MKTKTHCKLPAKCHRAISLALLIIFGILTSQGQSRINIFELMERRDLRLSEIEAIARKHFDEVGRIRGTGYKQYERWRYEKQFHLNAQGFLLPENYDALQYTSSSLSTTNVSAAADTWTEVGPKTWSRTSSWNPGVGRITSIAVYPADTTIIYVTTPGGGIWKSTQGGKQWVPLSDANNSLMNMFSITVDPSNADVVYAGNSGGELYKSTDGGTTWILKKSTGGSLRKILIDPTQPQTLFLASSGGLYKSVDGGSTFTKKLAVSIEDIEFKPGDPTTLYASGSTIYRSLDYGETWTQLTALANGITNTGRTLLGVSAADPLVVYAVQSNGSEFGRLYRSADGGNTFTTTITGSSTTCTNFFGYSSNGCGTGGQASYDMAITVNPLNANEVHIAGIICWKSTNGGTSFVAETEWSLPNSTGYNHADVHVLEWVGKTIYSGSDGGIYKSIDNGDNWIDLSLGLGTRQFYRIANSKTSTKLITGGAQDNGSSIYKSSGWIDWLGADGMDCIVSPLDSNLIWGTSQYGSLYRTSNGGSSYSGVSVPRSGNWVTPLAIESGKNVIYGGWKGIWKSTDLGVSWTKISIDTNNLVALAVAPSDPNYIYASTGSDLFVTTNGGSSWNKYLPSGVNISSIAIHPSFPDRIWISSSTITNRILYSSNAGGSFTDISGNLPAMAARSVVVDNTSEEGLYAGMNLGVYYKNKNMSSWVNLSGNLPLVAINEVELQPTTGAIRVATYGRGVWQRSAYMPCGVPGSINVSDVKDTSALLNWTAAASSNGYNVDYRVLGASTWTNLTSLTNTTSFTLAGLLPSTTYEWRVNSTCSEGSSDYLIDTFTTTTPCGKPSGLTTTAITTQTATLNWNVIDTALSYAVAYRSSSSNSWVTWKAATTQNTEIITGLSEGITYIWKVSATCNLGTGSADSAQFTTAITCLAPTSLATTNITVSSATLSWALRTGATGYDVDIRAVGAATWTSKATNLAGASLAVSGLTGGVTYQWRVRSNCGILSGFSNYDSTSFTSATPICTDTYENNNTTNQAKSIALNTEINALIGSASDSDYFKITSPNNTSTNIRVRLYNLPANYNLYLYDRNLVLVGSSIHTGTVADTVVYNSTAKKSTYYIKVTGVSGSNNSTTCYSLKAESSSTPFAKVQPIQSELVGIALPPTIKDPGLWKVYPQPVRNQVNLLYNSWEDAPLELQVWDTQGRLLLSQYGQVRKGANAYRIDLSKYQNGLYVIRMRVKDNYFAEKIILSR